MCFVYKYSVFLTIPAYLQCHDENIQQTRSFFVFKISWTIGCKNFSFRYRKSGGAVKITIL